MTVNFNDILDLIQSLIVIVALFLMYKSVPGNQIDALIERLSKPVQASDTKLDDVGLEILKLLRDLSKQLPTPTVADVGDDTHDLTLPLK